MLTLIEIRKNKRKGRRVTTDWGPGIRMPLEVENVIRNHETVPCKAIFVFGDGKHVSGPIMPNDNDSRRTAPLGKNITFTNYFCEGLLVGYINHSIQSVTITPNPDLVAIVLVWE